MAWVGNGPGYEVLTTSTQRGLPVEEMETIAQLATLDSRVWGAGATCSVNPAEGIKSSIRDYAPFLDKRTPFLVKGTQFAKQGAFDQTQDHRCDKRPNHATCTQQNRQKLAAEIISTVKKIYRMDAAKKNNHGHTDEMSSALSDTKHEVTISSTRIWRRLFMSYVKNKSCGNRNRTHMSVRPPSQATSEAEKRQKWRR